MDWVVSVKKNFFWLFGFCDGDIIEDVGFMDWVVMVENEICLWLFWFCDLWFLLGECGLFLNSFGIDSEVCLVEEFNLNVFCEIVILCFFFDIFLKVNNKNGFSFLILLFFWWDFGVFVMMDGELNFNLNMRLMMLSMGGWLVDIEEMMMVMLVGMFWERIVDVLDVVVVVVVFVGDLM